MKQYKFEDKLWASKQLDSGRDKRSVALEFYCNHQSGYSGKGIGMNVRSKRIKRLFMDGIKIRNNSSCI